MSWPLICSLFHLRHNPHIGARHLGFFFHISGIPQDIVLTDFTREKTVFQPSSRGWNRKKLKIGTQIPLAISNSNGPNFQRCPSKWSADIYGEICRRNQRFKCKVFVHPITIWIFECPPKWIHQILHQCYSRDFNILNVAGRDYPDSKLASHSTQKKIDTYFTYFQDGIGNDFHIIRRFQVSIVWGDCYRSIGHCYLASTDWRAHVEPRMTIRPAETTSASFVRQALPRCTDWTSLLQDILACTLW